jgi:hypothetical protein
MKNQIIILLTVILCISLFYNFKSKNNLQKNILEVQKVSFEQKQKCAIYKKDIESKFEKNNNEEKPLEYQFLDKVFYSPKQDSCLYTYNGMFGVKAKERYTTKYLVDALTGFILFQTTTVSEGKFDMDADNRFSEILKSYE